MSNNNNNTSMEVDINYDIIYEIVKKNPKDRSPDNIKYLMRLPVDILRESINPYAQLYARYFEFEEHKQNKQIFASKQKKNGVFWIIEGQFAVYNKKNIIVRAYKNLDYLSQSDIMNEFEDFQEVRALENTKVGYISDRILTELIEPLKKEARWQLHDFLSCTPLLCTWTFNQIKFLLTFFNTLTFGKNSYVFQEKQESTAVYFVKDGIFDIRKNFSGAADYDEKIQKEGIVIKDLPLSKIQKLQMKEFKISTLNLGDYFGEEDVLNDSNRTFSVLCNSLQGEVVYIQAEHFIEFIYKDLFCRSTIDQKLKKKEQLFQKREINIKGSLSNYGNFLVNEHFNKNLDQIITELAIQPQVKTYNELQKEQVIKQMQSLTNIQGASPRRNKGLIRNETLADIEELSDEAVAKMVNNNLFSKKRVQTEQKIEEIPDVPEKQILTIQDEDNKIQNPDQIQNRVDELVRINKQGKQNFLYDWRSKKNKEASHNRTPSEQYQKDAMEEYGSNPPSQPAERVSYQNNFNNEYYLDDELGNSPKRQNKNSSNSPLHRANTKFQFSYAQNQNSSPHSPKIVSMTDLFRFNTENNTLDDQFKQERVPFPQMMEKNLSSQNTGRLINIIPTVQKPLQKQNTLNLQLTDRQRSQIKQQNQNDQNSNTNIQIADQVASCQITNQSSNQELNSESNVYRRLYSSSQSPSRNEKMLERDSTKMKKIMEQVDDKFQLHHSNLQNQCQNFFTNSASNNSQVQLKMARQNSSKSPELKNGLVYEQQDELQQPDIIQLRNQSSSGSSNQQPQKVNVRIQNFELKDIQISQPSLQKKNNNLDSVSPTYKFMESPQFTGQKSSQDTVKLSQKSSTNSKLGLSSSPRIKNISSSSFTSNLFNYPNNSRINKNISFVEKIRSNVKGSFSNDKHNYFKQNSNDTPNNSEQPNLIQGAKSVSSVFHDYKNNQAYQKKSTLNDLYISQFQKQRSIEANEDDENDQQKNSLSLIQEDQNLHYVKQNANTFNFINSNIEDNQQMKSPNINRPLSSERKDNSAFQNGYDFSNIQSKSTQNQDLSSRRLLFYKTNTNFTHYKPQLPTVNRQTAIQNQNLSQKLLSERYQKFKLQHSQIKKQNPSQVNPQSQASQNQIEEFNSKPIVTSISNISQANNIGNNFSHNFISNQTVERQSQNDSVNENFFYHSNKTQKIITNKPTLRQENYSSNQNIFQKRAKSQNVLPPTTSYHDYKQMQKDQHLASPQDHLQKLLDKKEKMFRKHLFSSQGGQSQILQQTNHEINNPYFNTYIQLDYMNAYKISQAKPKPQVGGNLSATSQIIKYIPMSPDKKKIPDYPEKMQNRSGTRSNNRQLVS
ncbi:hypothetical protein ABPG74_015603 [Tetrahymena malaccensis]